MSAPEFQTNDQTSTAHQNIWKFKEDWKMNVATKVTRAKMAMSRGLATQRPVKLVGILVLGALFMAGTAVQFAPGSNSESVINPSVGNIEAGPTPNGIDPLGAFRMDESSGATHRLREELRTADRREDFQEMVRYWNQLKRDAASGSTSYYDEDENERAYDELRKSLIGIPYSGSSGNGLAVDPARQPFGSLLPDTLYYRDPDWREGQTMNQAGFDSPYPDTPYYRDPDWREGQIEK